MNAKAPAAFLSYARADDKYPKGKIVKVSEALSRELEAQTGEPFRIFVDRNDIDWGENWESRIYESLEAATLLIPVITPRYFKSKMCQKELSKFLEQERRIGRDDLILPIYYIETDEMEDPVLLRENALAQELARRQYADWRELRFASLSSRSVSETLEDLARRMRRALERGLSVASEKGNGASTTATARIAKAKGESQASGLTAMGGPSGLGVLRRRRLAYELWHLRESSGLSIAEVARDLDLSEATLVRMETGRIRARSREVAHLLDLYKVTGEERRALLRLARDAERAQTAWWTAYELSQMVEAYIAFEDAANLIDTYEPMNIPGLLQTEDYARETVYSVGLNLSPQGIERRVELRMARQASFFGGSLSKLSVILDEAALREPVGGEEVMRAQLYRLIEIAALPTVTIRILPSKAVRSVAAIRRSSGPFTIFTFPDSTDPDIVHFENNSEELFIEKPSEVQRYRQLFDRLAAGALTYMDSIEFMHSVARDL